MRCPAPAIAPWADLRVATDARQDDDSEPAAQTAAPLDTASESPIVVGELVSMPECGCEKGRLLTRKKGRCRVAVLEGPRAGEDIKCIATLLRRPTSRREEGPQPMEEAQAKDYEHDRGSETYAERSAAEPPSPPDTTSGGDLRRENAARRHREREAARKLRSWPTKGCAPPTGPPAMPAVTLNLCEATMPEDGCWYRAPPA